MGSCLNFRLFLEWWELETLKSLKIHFKNYSLSETTSSSGNDNHISNFMEVHTDNNNSIKTDIIIYLNKYIKCKYFSIAHIGERGPEIIWPILYEADFF